MPHLTIVGRHTYARRVTANQRSNTLPFRPDGGSMRQLDTRLATRISAQADRRLRLTALVHGMRLGHLLDQILSEEEPEAFEDQPLDRSESEEPASEELEEALDRRGLPNPEGLAESSPIRPHDARELRRTRTSSSSKERKRTARSPAMTS